MPENTKFDCLLNDEARCPYCGEFMTDSWELGDKFECDGETECGHCEKPFGYIRVVDVSYTTFKLEERKDGKN